MTAREDEALAFEHWSDVFELTPEAEASIRASAELLARPDRPGADQISSPSCE